MSTFKGMIYNMKAKLLEKNHDKVDLDNVDTYSDTSTMPSEAIQALKHEDHAPLDPGLPPHERPKVESTNLGGRLLPELGGDGLHPLQALCEENCRQCAFRLIKENRDSEKPKILEMLDDKEGAAQLGYAKLLNFHLTTLLQGIAKKEVEEPSLKILKIVFGGILDPLKNPVQLASDFNQGA